MTDTHDIAEQVQALIETATGVPVDWSDTAMGLHIRPEWSSLEHVRLMADLHEMFGVGRRPGDLETLTTPARILAEVCASEGESGPAAPPGSSEGPCTAGTPQVDRGLVHTYMDETRITDIDPARARLSYRGRDVPALARTERYEAVAHLLIEGEAGGVTRRQRALMLEGAYLARQQPSWEGTHDAFTARFASLPFASYVEPGPRDLRDQGWRLLGAAVQLVSGAAPVLAGDAGIADGLLPATGPACEGAADRDERERERREEDVRGLEQLMILQADHGSSAAALAVRTAISAGTGLHSALTAGMAAFGGRRHGGAMAEVVRMIEAVPEPDALRQVVRNSVETGRPVPGFGHRIYRIADPRVEPIRHLLRRAESLRGDDWWSGRLELMRAEMKRLEEAGAVANVDFYAGPLLRLYGFRAEAQTPVFAVARLAGWIAHAVEQAGTRTLIRPKLIYRGDRSTEAVS